MDYKKYNELCQKYFGNQGQYWSGREPKIIQEFLSEWIGYEIILCKIWQYTNQSNGYPYWRFDIINPKLTKPVIKENSVFKIQYIKSNTVQSKFILPADKTSQIRANRADINIPEKSKMKWPEDSVTIDSAMGTAVIGHTIGDVCIMKLPEHQGGDHEIKILEIN